MNHPVESLGGLVRLLARRIVRDAIEDSEKEAGRDERPECEETEVAADDDDGS